MNLVTFDDKVFLNENSDIPDINKIKDTDINQIKNAINNLIWPVGSYYETSDSTFDPNVTWGGTWVLDSAGKVTVAKDENDTNFDTLGETGGEKTHTLTIDEMPSHSHDIKALDNPDWYVGDVSGIGGQHSVANALNTNATFSQPHNSTLYTAAAVGGGSAHNNLQPYIVVNRWHRTA